MRSPSFSASLLMAISLTASFIGCAIPHVLPSRKVQRELQSVDAIEFDGIRITDSATIERLRSIHRHCRWDPMPTTMPADLIAIYGVKNEKRKFKIVYGAGWLMDTDEDGKIVRLGTLRENDSQWMETNIRARLPANPYLM